jgi:chloramphenicol-sensitive protein RarD
MEAGLAYYIMPLLTVVLGVAFLGERLSRRQWFAVALAAGAVVVLTVGLGAVPWLALGLATSFALYSLVRRQVSTGPIIGFFVETMLIVPAAVVWIWGVETQGWTGPDGREGALFGTDWKTTALLVLSGPVTSVPLILFAEAARAMPLSRVGLVQYINPSLQVAVAALVLGEMFTPWHGVALVLIWLGLGLFSSEIFRQERASRRAATSASTVLKTLR